MNRSGAETTGLPQDGLAASVANREFQGKNLQGGDWSCLDLSGVKFIRCNLSDATFRGAKLSHAQFVSCTADRPVSFEEAEMTGVVMRQCRFRHALFRSANLSNAKISTTNLSGSNLLGCRFNGAFIDGLNISNCNLNMTSFINTQITSIDYLPVKHIPFMRGLRFFRRTAIRHNCIFINRNQHLKFTAYCNSEVRKDRFFTSVDGFHPLVRPFALMLLALFGLTTNFGQSFTRWLLCTSFFIALFGMLYRWLYDVCVPDAAVGSVLAFFGFGRIVDSATVLYAVESVTGYFMLGILISLLTSKLSTN